jgi:hypothetical protein
VDLSVAQSIEIVSPLVVAPADGFLDAPLECPPIFARAEAVKQKQFFIEAAFMPKQPRQYCKRTEAAVVDARLRASGASWQQIADRMGIGVGIACRALQQSSKIPAESASVSG